MSDYGLEFSSEVATSVCDLARSLRRAGVSLPVDFLHSFVRWNGREAMRQYVYDGQPRERVSLHFFHDLLDSSNVQELKSVAKTHGLKELFPVACDEGGNFICVHSKRGSIWFIDHEVEGTAGQFHLEPSLERFMQRLRPFEP